ncbi:MAG: methylated-DNA--[protein]-cysteine S-methyltransferase [Pseudomonadota bacterium]|nr:methylated-DNA--[protein]-cysteine S-methyltransferase [Pseudomonadota bacterium]
MTSLFAETILVTPVGRILLHTSETQLYGVELFISNDFLDNETVISTFAQQVINKLKSYFIDPQSECKLKLAERGTVFQRRVWQYLQTIPPGETRTYTELAQALDTSGRAVGNACRANPFAIVVPCHRIVSKAGLGGYYGKTDGSEIDLKQWLLEHERHKSS